MSREKHKTPHAPQHYPRTVLIQLQFLDMLRLAGSSITRPALSRPESNSIRALQQRRQRFAVRHNDQNRVLLRLQFQQQLGDRLRRGAIEISGRLIGQEQQSVREPVPGQSPRVAVRRPKVPPADASTAAPNRHDSKRSIARRWSSGVAAPSAKNGTNTFSSTVHCGSRW